MTTEQGTPRTDAEVCEFTPTSHPDYSGPYQWVDAAFAAMLERELAAAYLERDRQVKELREALEHIAHPLKWEQDHLPEGYSINGGALIQLVSSADYYQNIAREALRAAPAAKEQDNG